MMNSPFLLILSLQISESEKTDSAPAIDSETDTITSDYDGNKRTKLKLWRKVQNVFQPVNKSFAHSVDSLPEENLPSYDDLFPNDSSIRSLMKFTTSSFTKDAQERQISDMPETLNRWQRRYCSRFRF
ncbi:GQ67_05291T0 [Komagataella phaffii]|nr:GQ67_05291T0 [Komagataella phaffii]